MGEVIQESVNSTTQRLAPTKSVHEIGKVLPRLFHFIALTPEDQEIRLSSIVVPSALQMGWAESPAYFYAATKTGRDLIDMLLREGVDLPEHTLEKFMEPQDIPKTTPPEAEERTSVGVYYVDGYVLGVVENDDRSLIRRVSWATLHAIHSIFPP